MINNTNIKIPKKYEKYIESIEIGYGYDEEYFRDGKAYELTLKECCLIDGSGLIEYSSQKELLKELRYIKVVNLDEYKYETGKRDEESIEQFMKDYKEVTGEDYPCEDSPCKDSPRKDSPCKNSLLDKMNVKSIDEVVDFVTKNGFGRDEFTFPGLFISKGIKYVYEKDRDIWDKYIEKALKQVEKKDYGGFYEDGEKVIEGEEYYLCESPFGKDINHGIIIHCEDYTTIIYFQFER